MTKRELNRDCKRLLKMAVKNSQNSEIRENIRKEIYRLYLLDKYFCNMSKESILILLRLNLRYVVIPLHTFGIYIELEKL